MALFKNVDGGVMDSIRCDEQDYLIWKWHPKGTSSTASQRANAIRWGSSLRVRDGSVAVFVYAGPDGQNQDFIEGPCDILVETSNFPVLATLVGKLYDGGSPFPAEIYFINLAELIQIKFGVPFFDIFDPRFTDFGIPAAVRGAINFRIADYREFIKLHRLDSFNMGMFKIQVKDTVVRLVKEVVANAPSNDGIPAIQIERHISEINALVEAKLTSALRESYGVSVSRIDISDIEIDKDSAGYKKLLSLTQNKANIFTQAATNIVDTVGTHRTGAKRISQTVKEEGKQVDGSLDFGEVGKGVADAIGGAAGAIGGFFSGLGKQKETTPPPVPIMRYYAVQDGEQAWPFTLDELGSLAVDGKLDAETLVWKDGMSSWEPAGSVNELADMLDRRDESPLPLM